MSEVPDSHLAAIQKWRQELWSSAHVLPSAALDFIAAMDLEPEWEPSDEMVERYMEATSAYNISTARCILKRLHAAGFRMTLEDKQ